MGLKEHLEHDILEEGLKNICENMSGPEIAKELGITRQRVSNILKWSLEKIYIGLKQLNPTDTPFEIATQMLVMFKQEKEAAEFYSLFPPKIKKEIQADAVKRWPSKTLQVLKNA